MAICRDLHPTFTISQEIRTVQYESLNAHIQGVPGGMCQTSGGCYLC